MPKKTLKTIIDTGNDYLVQVKGNQPNLLKALKETAATQDPISIYETTEKKRGRNEFRKVLLFKPINNIPLGWEELNSIIHVERITQRKGKITNEKSFYISSLNSEEAEFFAKGIRGHWSIENRLHWVKDVIQNEDNAAIKKGNGIETLSILKNIAINLSRTFGYDSIKEAQIYFASNVKELYKKIRT